MELLNKKPEVKPERLTYTVKKIDVGKYFLDVYKPNGDSEQINLSGVCGYIMEHDVGKRMLKRQDSWSIENDEQLKTRLAYD